MEAAGSVGTGIIVVQETNAMNTATMASVKEIPSTHRTTPVVRPCRASIAVLTRPTAA
jgi:hypothetical protein